MPSTNKTNGSSHWQTYRIGDIYTLVVGVESCISTIENGMTVLQEASKQIYLKIYLYHSWAYNSRNASSYYRGTFVQPC